jgi:hypothetical protein
MTEEHAKAALWGSDEEEAAAASEQLLFEVPWLRFQASPFVELQQRRR